MIMVDAMWTKVERDIFDVSLAEGDTVATAGRRCGRSLAAARRQFERICAFYGWQAT